MLDEMVVRKVVSILDETCVEAKKRLERPVRKGAAIAVIENPYAGRYVDDLSPLYAFGERLGSLLV